ncbi:MAG TPA: ADP-forming succinate--CoA ligase subunit beta [Vicinamibacterales bacterium]|nr:ADP-forming succinate--CoA ligase subunit beta [Vicinamibacterales bacterium]
MKIHEYQAKAILAKHGVPVPKGEVVFTAEEARAAAQRLGGGTVVVKAQIHAGGRGKGGGVKVVKGPDEAAQAASKMLGSTLVTYQTGPHGQKVGRVLVEQGLAIKRELYLGLVIDRATERPVLMVSREGGVEIEKVAAETPDRIVKAAIHPGIGLSPYQTRKLAFALGLEGPQVAQAGKFMSAVWDAFKSTDASLIEINPLIVTEDGSLIALDAKMNFDDNALYRHTEIKDFRDLDEEAPLEVEASRYSLNYIKLDGTIGCMVNGAGLAMATMDIIKLAGGEPANFLDVGGGANAEQIRNAFKILMSDKNVRAVFINIFGGILRCDVLAEGVIAAVRELGVPVPIVIRMEGTNVEKGKQMLKESGLNFATADSMGEAAEQVVRLAAAAPAR